VGLRLSITIIFVCEASCRLISARPTRTPRKQSRARSLASVAANQGDAAAVAVLVESDPEITSDDSYGNWGQYYRTFTLRLRVAPAVFGLLGAEREALTKRLSDLASEATGSHNAFDKVASVVIAPAISEEEGWRSNAQKWLRGEGINNQGRVRSDNIAARQHDGLLFQSQAEINLHVALKSCGVYLAPLPVFIRGGATYQRREPDFVLVRNGVLMVVEVDGATVHKESPVEADERTQGLALEGVRVERVLAPNCELRDACCGRQSCNVADRRLGQVQQSAELRRPQTPPFQPAVSVVSVTSQH